MSCRRGSRVAKHLVQRVDELQRCAQRVLAKTEIDRPFDITIGSRPQDGALVARRPGRRRTAIFGPAARNSPSSRIPERTGHWPRIADVADARSRDS
jgi:hypothetical protein